MTLKSKLIWIESVNKCLSPRVPSEQVKWRAQTSNFVISLWHSLCASSDDSSEGVSCLLPVSQCLSVEPCRSLLRQLAMDCAWTDNLDSSFASWTGLGCAVVSAASDIADGEEDAERQHTDHEQADGEVVVDGTTMWRRQACLESVAALFETVDDELGQSLAFCRCESRPVMSGATRVNPDRHLVTLTACEAARRMVRPACSLVELPPPSCTDILRRCLENEDCRLVSLHIVITCWSKKNIMWLENFLLDHVMINVLVMSLFIA